MWFQYTPPKTHVVCAQIRYQVVIPVLCNLRQFSVLLCLNFLSNPRRWQYLLLSGLGIIMGEKQIKYLQVAWFPTGNGSDKACSNCDRGGIFQQSSPVAPGSLDKVPIIFLLQSWGCPLRPAWGSFLFLSGKYVSFLPYICLCICALSHCLPR